MKLLLLTSLLLSGKAALATPQADARLAAQRYLYPVSVNTIGKVYQGIIEKAFVEIYFRPISGPGVEIADLDGFADLIPDEDVAPYVDHMTSEVAEAYLSFYTPEQLASIAAILRADKDATLEDIISEKYQRQRTAALEQARANAQHSGSDDPYVLELEEWSMQMNAFNEAFKGGVTQATINGPTLHVIHYANKIRQIEKKPDNPVSIAAIKADGVLWFANPVQRQTLLRQLSSSERTGGIVFTKPPTTDTLSK